MRDWLLLGSGKTEHMVAGILRQVRKVVSNEAMVHRDWVIVIVQTEANGYDGVGLRYTAISLSV